MVRGWRGRGGGRGGGKADDKEPPVCWICQSPDHFSYDCPKKNADKDGAAADARAALKGD